MKFSRSTAPEEICRGGLDKSFAPVPQRKQGGELYGGRIGIEAGENGSTRDRRAKDQEGKGDIGAYQGEEPNFRRGP